MATTCETFPNKYIKNLKYITTSLQSIIDNHILIDSGPAESPSNCDTSTPPAKIFDCEQWCKIRALLSNPDCEPTDTVNYLQALIDTLDCILGNVDSLDYDIKAQIKRFKCVVNYLRVRINSICCVEEQSCQDIVGDLLCVLMQVLTTLISATSKIATIVYYANCAKSGNRVASVFINCLICDFVNDVCELERLLEELMAISNAFNSCFMDSCTPCTISPCAPPKRRPMCPPSIMNNPKPQFSGYKRPGCGCDCN